MRRLISALTLIALALVVVPNVATAQKWSSEQQEVWTVVEAMNRTWGDKNVEEFLKYFHSRGVGWEYSHPQPYRGDKLRDWVRFYLQGDAFTVVQATPSYVEVHGNVAVTSYYLSWGTKDAQGLPLAFHGRYMLTLLKESDRWRIIGYHGGLVEVE